MNASLPVLMNAGWTHLLLVLPVSKWNSASHCSRHKKCGAFCPGWLNYRLGSHSLTNNNKDVYWVGLSKCSRKCNLSSAVWSLMFSEFGKTSCVCHALAEFNGGSKPLSAESFLVLLLHICIEDCGPFWNTNGNCIWNCFFAVNRHLRKWI